MSIITSKSITHKHVCIINSLGIISSVTHVTQRYKSFVF